LSVFKKVFTGHVPFEAMNACRAWLDERGYSYGSTCVMNPTGVLKGDFDIAKWRNLTRKEIAALDGQINGNTRDGPVTLVLKSTPDDHLE
jgi:hypothetical protein